MTEETADQRMRRMAKEYGIPYTPPATAAPAAPVQAQQPAPPAKKPSMGDGIMGLLGGRKQQLEEQERKAMGYANGGLLSSPLGSLPSMQDDGLSMRQQSRQQSPASMPDPFGGDFDAINAEKTARWKIQDVANSAKYANNNAERKGILGDLSNLLGDYSKQYGVNEMAFANGGKIKGPGTPTSDSIGGVVKETGEPIKVSTEERIVSAAQEQALARIAEMLGYESVDAMFEAMTGKPVGPTIKGGMKAAATGMGPEDDPVKRGIATMREQLAPQQPAPTAQQVYAGVGPGGLSSNYVGNGPTDPDVNGRNAVAQSSGAVQRGIATMQSQLNQSPAPMFADNAKASASGEAHLKSLYPAGTFDKPPVSAAPAVKPMMVAEEAAIRAKNEAVMSGVQSAADPAALAALKAKNAPAAGIAGARMLTQPAGTVAPGGRDISGQKLITNVADGAKVDDSSASALRDQQSNNPYWSPAAQLERMQRRRLETDAFDPSITDPRVRDTAQKALGILGNPADQQLKQAQAQGIFGQNESNAQLAALQKKALSGDQQALATLAALRGKGADYKGRYITLPNRKVYNDMGHIVGEEPGGIFDAATGQAVQQAGTKQAGKQAPASAIEYLKKNPTQAAAFKAKYGYLPEGF